MEKELSTGLAWWGEIHGLTGGAITFLRLWGGGVYNFLPDDLAIVLRDLWNGARLTIA